MIMTIDCNGDHGYDNNYDIYDNGDDYVSDEDNNDERTFYFYIKFMKIKKLSVFLSENISHSPKICVFKYSPVTQLIYLRRI